MCIKLKTEQTNQQQTVKINITTHHKKNKNKKKSEKIRKNLEQE